MNRKKEKGYRLKMKETFRDGPQARSRAKILRMHEHIEHFHLESSGDKYTIAFAIAKWYFEQLNKAGVKL